MTEAIEVASEIESADIRIPSGSLRETILQRFFDDPSTIDKGESERFIKTIWGHLSDLQELNDEGNLYDELVTFLENNGPAVRYRFHHLFLNNIEDGYIPIDPSTESDAKNELLSYMQILRAEKTHYWESGTASNAWLPIANKEGWFGRSKSHVFDLRYFPGILTVQPERVYPAPDRNPFKQGFYALMVPRGGVTLEEGNRNLNFNCQIVLLFVTRVYITTYEKAYQHIVADRRKCSLMSLSGVPVVIDVRSGRSYVDRTRFLYFEYNPNKHDRRRNWVRNSMDVNRQGTNIYTGEDIDRIFSYPGWFQKEGVVPREELMQSIPATCRIPYDLYAFKFSVLEETPQLKWLYYLLRFQQSWTEKYGRELKLIMEREPLARPNILLWSGLTGPYYHEQADPMRSFHPLHFPHPDRNVIDQSTPTTMAVYRRPGQRRKRSVSVYDRFMYEVYEEHREHRERDDNENENDDENGLHQASGRERLASANYKRDCEHSCVIL